MVKFYYRSLNGMNWHKFEDNMQLYNIYEYIP